MKHVYEIIYEQKFGRDWFEYTNRVISGDCATGAIYKMKRVALDQTLDDVDCSGFRVISIVRTSDVDY